MLTEITMTQIHSCPTSVGGRGGCSPPLQPKEESSIVRVGWVGELDAAPM